MNYEKIDKYDYLIAMATLDAKNNDVEMFENLDTSDVIISNQVVRKINRLINTNQRNRDKNINKVRMVLSRVAIIVLVVISMMFTAMMSVSAVRNAVWNVIVEWYDKYISVDYETDDSVSPPTVIEEVRKPTLLPLGFEEDVIFDDKWSYLAEYYVGDECRLVFGQSLLNKGSVDVDSDETAIENVIIGVFDGILLTYEKNTDVKLIWNDGEYLYTLKVEKINSGKLPIIDQEIEKYFSNIKLNFDATIDGEADYRDAEFVIISTSTNYDETKRCFDTSSVECVIQQIISVNPDGVKAFLLYHNAT